MTLLFCSGTYSCAWLSHQNSLPLNTWIHVAITRDASHVIRTFMNGVMSTSTITSSVPLTDMVNGFLIGTGGNQWDNNGFPGYIDEVRVTKGIARYTNSFFPPTNCFPNQ